MYSSYMNNHFSAYYKRKSAVLQNAAVCLAMLFVLSACIDDKQTTDLPYKYQLDYLEDIAGTLTIDNLIENQSQLDWLVFHEGDSSPGYTDSNYWLKMTVENHSEKDPNIYWVMSDTFFDHLQRYDVIEGEAVAYLPVGLLYPQKNRELKHRYQIFKINVPVNSKQQVFVQVDSHSALTFHSMVLSKEALEEMDWQQQLWVTAFVSIVMSLVLYNLFIYFGTRETSYLYYCLNSTAMCALLVAIEGWLFYFFPENKWVTTHLFDVILFLFSATCLLYVRSFLITADTMPKLDRWLSGLMWGMLFLAVLSIFYQSSFLEQIGAHGLILTIILAFCIGAHALMHGYKMARLFCAGWAFILIGGFFSVLAAMGMISSFLFYVESVRIAQIVEVLLMSLALVDRLQVIRDETIRSQEEAKSKLEDIVALRTEELTLANSRLAELSRRDGLTGVMNRRHFDEVIIEEAKNSKIKEQSLGLLLIDIDNFKLINDRYGHQAGDDIIIQVAQTLSRCASRQIDMVARYGGEEFVVVLPNTNEAGAKKMADKMRSEIANNIILDSPVTISIGVVAKLMSGQEDFKQLIESADRALYQAKANGRNCVVLAVE